MQTQCHNSPPLGYPLYYPSPCSFSLSLSATQGETRVTRANIRRGSESLRVATPGVYPPARANKPIFKSLTISKGGGVELERARACAHPSKPRVNYPGTVIVPRFDCCRAVYPPLEHVSRAPNTGFEERLRNIQFAGINFDRKHAQGNSQPRVFGSSATMVLERPCFFVEGFLFVGKENVGSKGRLFNVVNWDWNRGMLNVITYKNNLISFSLFDI